MHEGWAAWGSAADPELALPVRVNQASSRRSVAGSATMEQQPRVPGLLV